MGGVEDTGEKKEITKEQGRVAYSSICDFFLPAAGSFIGILMVSFGEAMTIDRIAEYSLHISLSSTVQ